MAHIKLILLEDVESLGLAGEEVHVAPGYARNFLLPRNLAAKATPGILRLLASKRERLEAARQNALNAAQAVAAKMAEQAFEVPMQAGEDGQLFGSVTTRMLSEALKKAGFEVEHQRITIEGPIKMLGEYVVSIKLHHSVTATAKIAVVRA